MQQCHRETSQSCCIYAHRMGVVTGDLVFASSSCCPLEAQGHFELIHDICFPSGVQSCSVLHGSQTSLRTALSSTQKIKSPVEKSRNLSRRTCEYFLTAEHDNCIYLELGSDLSELIFSLPGVAATSCLVSIRTVFQALCPLGYLHSVWKSWRGCWHLLHNLATILVFKKQ